MHNDIIDEMLILLSVIYYLIIRLSNLITGEKQAAVHHDQWNAACINCHAIITEFFAVFINFLFYMWQSYSL